MPIVAGEILVANAATTTTRRLASSATGMLSFLARLSGRRRRHVRRSGPGAAVAGATAETAATAAAAAAGDQQPAAVMDPEQPQQQQQQQPPQQPQPQQQQQPPPPPPAPPAPPECYRCRCQRCSCACLGLDEEASRPERAEREARGARQPREDPEARPRLDRRPRPASSLASGQRPRCGPEELLRRRPPEGRPLLPPYIATLLILAYGLIGMADACSSRSTPKPRPPTPTPRPNITFHMYTCPPDYAEWYCLNGATCFTVKIVDSLLYNCLCANGYIGQRCEFKDLDGSYLPSRQRVMLETASIAGAVTIAVFLAVITFISVYIHCKRKQKELRTSGVDAVDGPAGRDLERRPFGGHSRSRLGFITKSPNSLMTVPSIEQTRMPNWNYPNQVSMRIDSVNESKHPSQYISSDHVQRIGPDLLK